jgi:hypothetical protein
VKVTLQKFLTFLIPALRLLIPPVSLWIRNLYITLEKKPQCFSETSQQSFIAKIHFASRIYSEIWNWIWLNHLILIISFIWWILIARYILIFIWTTITQYYIILGFFLLSIFIWIIQLVLGSWHAILLILDVDYIFHQIYLA